MSIRITSKKNGFWRCGVQHTATPVTYPDGRFSEKELETLKAEPMLVVEALGAKDISLSARGAKDANVSAQDDGRKNR